MTAAHKKYMQHSTISSTDEVVDELHQNSKCAGGVLKELKNLQENIEYCLNNDQLTMACENLSLLKDKSELYFQKISFLEKNLKDYIIVSIAQENELTDFEKPSEHTKKEEK